jgi:hypothetical protein
MCKSILPYHIGAFANLRPLIDCSPILSQRPNPFKSSWARFPALVPIPTPAQNPVAETKFVRLSAYGGMKIEPYGEDQRAQRRPSQIYIQPFTWTIDKRALCAAAAVGCLHSVYVYSHKYFKWVRRESSRILLIHNNPI